MRRFIFTLGYHEDHIIRRLIRCACTPEDEVVVLTGKPANIQVRRAFQGLTSFMVRAKLKEPIMIEVPQAPEEGISTVASAITSDAEIIADLSGGMRYLIVYFMLALAIVKPHATHIYVQPESGEELEVSIPKAVIKLVTEPPTPAEQLILKEVIKKPGVTPEEISLITGRKVKTVRNLLSRLSMKGLIVRKGRGGGAYPSRSVKLLKYLSLHTAE